VPEVVNAAVEGFARDWWQQQRLADTGMSLAQIVLEYQFQVCRYIVERLRSPDTPEEVRDAFAMRGLPNLGVVLKSTDAMTVAISAGTPAQMPVEQPTSSAPAPNVSSVLEAYRVAGKLPQ
jgi:hypothetical protein